MKYNFKWSWCSNKSEWHDTGWDWESFPCWLFRFICFQFNPTWDRDNCRGWAACSGPGPSCRLQMVQLTAHYADNISLWLSGVNTSPVASAAQSQVTSPDLMRSWGDVMMCLRVGVCVTNGLLLPGYLRLAMELQRPVLTNIAGTMLRASACPAQPASASLRPASLC